MSFKVGEIVQLKSGGPKMTIVARPDTALGAMPGYRTSWFAGSKLEHGYFPLDALELPPEKPAK
jgi:uncharacterized protein YodC (DUF2158 family)